jgi:hypothetical protein
MPMREVTIRNWVRQGPIDLGSEDDNYSYLLDFTPTNELDWKAAKRFLADRISRSYLSLETLHDSLERFGMATLVERVRKASPTSTARQKSEFGEIVCQLVFAGVYSLIVPVKHRYKDSPNVPVHGVDVIAFRFDPSDSVGEDTLYLAEVKTSGAKQNPPSVAYELRDDLKALSLSDISSDLQYVLENMKDELTDWYERIVEFHDPYELHKRRMRLCPFVVRDRSFWKPVDIKCIIDELYDYPVSLTVVTFDNLDDLALEIYRLARVENG